MPRLFSESVLPVLIELPFLVTLSGTLVLSGAGWLLWKFVIRKESFQKFLYDARHSLWIWIILLIISLILAGIVFAVVNSLEGSGDRPISGGFWTFLLAVSATPIVWYAWFIRDRNRVEELKNDKYKNIRENFYKLQEWAVSDREGQVTTALFQLRDYLREDPDLIPEELKEYRPVFARLARDFFAVILKDRAVYDRHYRLWKEANDVNLAVLSETTSLRHGDYHMLRKFRGKELTEVPKSAPFRAMERIVREDGWRIQDLREAQLEYAVLWQSDSVAKLEGVDLSEADLTGADLRSATLTGANLISARLTGANLEFARLTGAYLEFARLTGAYLEFARLIGADLRRATLTGAYLRFATLTGADLRFATLTGADLRRATLTGAYLMSATLSGANLMSATLTGADLRSATLPGANLMSATLIGADLMSATLTGANLWYIQLDGVDLSHAVLNGAGSMAGRCIGVSERSRWAPPFWFRKNRRSVLSRTGRN